MTIPIRSRKGLQNINTHTDRTLRVTRPHRAYMRISAIEMEKTRRMTEKQAILDRLAEIDRRLTNLNGEKDQLLRLLGERPGDAPATGRRQADRPKHLTHARPAGGSKTKAGAQAGGSSGSLSGARAVPRNKRRPSRPGGSARSKRSGPGALRPLPEWTGNGLKIKY